MPVRCATGWVANLCRHTANNCNYFNTVRLEVPQHSQTDEVANMQTGRGRVEPSIHTRRRCARTAGIDLSLSRGAIYKLHKSRHVGALIQQLA
eukprot:SAG31_NODE_16525_length_705_cov_1.683168_1_plen_93_part_00